MYIDENSGTPDFVKYHKKQLQACGVHFGLNGYEAHDLHTKSLYRVQIGDTTYSGGVDGGVLRYSVDTESAAMLLRGGFEHKQSTKDKAAFRKNNPHLKKVSELLNVLHCSLSCSACLHYLCNHAFERMHAG